MSYGSNELEMSDSLLVQETIQEKKARLIQAKKSMALKKYYLTTVVVGFLFYFFIRLGGMHDLVHVLRFLFIVFMLALSGYSMYSGMEALLSHTNGSAPTRSALSGHPRYYDGRVVIYRVPMNKTKTSAETQSTEKPRDQQVNTDEQVDSQGIPREENQAEGNQVEGTQAEEDQVEENQAEEPQAEENQVEENEQEEKVEKELLMMPVKSEDDKILEMMTVGY